MLETLKKGDIAQMTDAQLTELCAEIREFLVQSVAKTGGHLASSLGVVELTVALHRVFDPYADRIIFDVGHQCYAHKLLTGRAEGFASLRSLGGMSGYPKPSESPADAFVAGHASNSVSAAIGMARARTLLHEHHSVVAVLGDGAMTGGLAYEGLADAGSSGEPVIVILNDNGMSIKKNVGGVSSYLAMLRLRPSYYSFKKTFRAVAKKLPGGRFIYRVVHSVKERAKRFLLSGSLIENMGFVYMGPVSGHDIPRLTYCLRVAKSLGVPVFLHVVTQKGRGYRYSERRPEDFHGTPPFDPATGELLSKGGGSFSREFGRAISELARRDPRVCAITASMQSGTGLEDFFREFPERAFDTGITEGHAAVMTAAMAKRGLLPVFAVYSTFLQRAFDMLIHDAALDGAHAVFAIDRAGVVGGDGETHQGAFDVAMAAVTPGMTLYAPSNYAELRSMLKQALYDCSGPAALRYPKCAEGAFMRDTSANTSAVLRRGRNVNILTYGRTINAALDAAALLEEAGVSAGVIKLNRLCPLELEGIPEDIPLLVAEEAADPGSVGERLAARLKCPVKRKNMGNGIVSHGNADALLQTLGLDAEGIADTVTEWLKQDLTCC